MCCTRPLMETKYRTLKCEMRGVRVALACKHAIGRAREPGRSSWPRSAVSCSVILSPAMEVMDPRQSARRGEHGQSGKRSRTWDHVGGMEAGGITLAPTLTLTLTLTLNVTLILAPTLTPSLSFSQA